MLKVTIINLFSDAPVTAIITSFIFLVSCLAFYNKKVFGLFILHPYSIVKDRAYYRLFTSDFVHNDIMHLVLNEFMLYVFCSDLEEHLKKQSHSGSLTFLVIYLTSMLTGSIIVTLRHWKDFNYSTTGPSGSILGCMFSFILLDPNYVALNIPGIGEIKNLYSGLLYILFLIGYSNRKDNQMINHELHFFGALGGIAATIILFPSVL